MNLKPNVQNSEMFLAKASRDALRDFKAALVLNTALVLCRAPFQAVHDYDLRLKHLAQSGDCEKVLSSIRGAFLCVDFLSLQKCDGLITETRPRWTLTAEFRGPQLSGSRRVPAGSVGCWLCCARQGYPSFQKYVVPS